MEPKWSQTWWTPLCTKQDPPVSRHGEHHNILRQAFGSILGSIGGGVRDPRMTGGERGQNPASFL